MITFKTQKGLLGLARNGKIRILESVEFLFDLSSEVHLYIAGNINAGNINALDIMAGNIKAGNIDALDIDAGHIDAGNIYASDIDAGHIKARDIKARDINARDIGAGDIEAKDISYHSVCFAVRRFKCRSVAGRRKNSKHFCLDSEIVFK